MPKTSPKEDGAGTSSLIGSAHRSPPCPPLHFSSHLSLADKMSSEVVSVSSATGSEARMDTSLAIRSQPSVYSAPAASALFTLFQVCEVHMPDGGAAISPEMASGESDQESQDKTESEDDDEELERLQVLPSLGLNLVKLGDDPKNGAEDASSMSDSLKLRLWAERHGVEGCLAESSSLCAGYHVCRA